jgi:hypothetical protein
MSNISGLSRPLCSTLALSVFLGACAHAKNEPVAVAPPLPAAATWSASTASAPSTEAALVSRSAELLALAQHAAPDAKTALVVGRGARALAHALRARAINVEERDPVAVDTASRPTFDVVIAPEVASASAARALLGHVFANGLVVARWIDDERAVASAADGHRFASFTAPIAMEDHGDHFEHLLIERAGSAALGLGDVARTLGLLPSESFMRDEYDPSPRPSGKRVKLAGYVVRLPSGEVVVDVPHLEQGATRVDAPAVAAQLGALAGSKVSPVWDGKAIDPRSLTGALQTGTAMVGTRTSAVIVVVEGWLALRSWNEAPSGADLQSGVRAYELTDARISSTVRANAWTRAFAQYEADVKAKLTRELQSATPVRAELAIDHVIAPIERLTPNDAHFFEAVRFWRRLWSTIFDLYRIQTPSPGFDGALVTWTAKTLPERNLEAGLLHRPRPTAAEREAYRSMFMLGAVLSTRASDEAEQNGKTNDACRLLAESRRLWHAYDADAAYVREFDQVYARKSTACGLDP